MGVFHVSTESASTPLADVEYRFDSSTGVFFAEYSDEVCEHAVREELRKAVTELVRARHVIDYQPFIHVEVPRAYGKRGYSERAELTFSYDTLLVSRQRLRLPNGGREYQLTKQAHEVNGELVARNQYGSDGRFWPDEKREGDVLLPYTLDRLNALRAIEDAIHLTHGRLLEVISDARLVDQVAINGAARIGLLGAAVRTEKAG